MVQMKLKGSLLENFHLFQNAGVLVLFRPSTDLVRPTHIIEGKLFYTEFTNLNVNLIQKHPPG